MGHALLKEREFIITVHLFLYASMGLLKREKNNIKQCNMTFEQLGLDESLVKAVSELGFTTPTEIQQKAIPVFLKREKDLIALAQTGTGKTAAFGLPILHNLDIFNKATQALIISPTRELCMQITNDLKNYSKHQRGLRVTAVYGGSSIMAQIEEIRQGAHIIVATPGRLIDLLDRKAVKLDQVQTVVLDEADEMLNMGFQEDMETILAQTPEDKITGLFSATMPKEIRNIASTYLREYEEVSSGKKNSASTSISHQYAVVQAKDKLAALKRIIDFHPDFFGIIFCTTRIETQEISDAIVKAGYNADCLHGDLSQQQRDKVMGKFRKRTIKILCATDVAARGIDVNDITHVIHYHLPDDIENYTHRSGRTARAGKTGTSIALLHIREAYKLHQIEKIAGIKFEKYMIPNGEEIIANKVQQFVKDFLEMDMSQTDQDWQNELISPLLQMDKAELVQRMLAKEFRKVDPSYTSNTDLNVNEQNKSDRKGKRSEQGNDRFERRDRSEGKSRRDKFAPDENTSRLFINLGKKDNLRYDEMRELIFRETKVSGHHIKDIEMAGVFSFFETDAKSAERIMENFKNVEINGREVRIDRADGQNNMTGGQGNSRKSFGQKSKAPSEKFRGTTTPFAERKKKIFSSAKSGDQKPRYKKKDELSW